ncbi:MAG: hydrogenase maturation protease [Granulosicoccus sp.]|nr:hydrogenase maturation protease [Granulosicoccus sp.]
MSSLAGGRPAPWLILAIGNPSRGDDALGPVFIERLQRALTDLAEAGNIEFLTDFQLQVEHALDLLGRRAVLFVDAALPGVVSEVAIEAVPADAGVTPTSHALRPGAVLNIAMRINGHAPPAWQLAIEGREFALGEGLSSQAELNLGRAILMAQRWLRDRGCTGVIRNA